MAYWEVENLSVAKQLGVVAIEENVGALTHEEPFLTKGEKVNLAMQENGVVDDVAPLSLQYGAHVTHMLFEEH